MNSNKLVLSLDDNKELRDYLAKKGPGDTCTLEVTGKIDEILPDQLVVSVKSADVVGEPEAPEPSMMEGDEPMPGMMDKKMSGMMDEKSPSAALFGGAKH